jgi:glutathione synthase/RimK-type ligase-like ATP-grasp enzyme
MWMKKAIVVAHQNDIHAHAVRHAARSLGAEIHILDIQEFTISYNLRTRIGKSKSKTTLEIPFRQSRGTLDLATISGIWWRRPYPYANQRRSDIPGNIFTTVQGERRVAIMGSLDCFIGNAFNDPGRSRQASHKPTQLIRARDIGLTIPDTLITNDADAVKEFVDSVAGRAIYKMFRGTSFGFFGTRPFGELDFSNLDRLQTCPAIFQEYIEGEYDIRVIVVGDKIFAARLAYDQSSEIIDTRLLHTEIAAYELPSDIENKLVQLVKSFGLVYSAIDMRYSNELGYVFFELNPEGQFLWIEIEADLPISHEIAAQLLK